MSGESTSPGSLLLAGKTVLVTGASRGIGRATALAAHREGAHVVAHRAGSEQAALDLQRLLGDRGHLVRADLREPRDTETLWQEALAWRGRIDVLVNNAGAWLGSPLEDAAQWHQGWADNLALNLTGPADLSRNAVLHFRECGGGIVVSVSSRSAHRGDDARVSNYVAGRRPRTERLVTVHGPADTLGSTWTTQRAAEDSAPAWCAGADKIAQVSGTTATTTQASAADSTVTADATAPRR